MSLGAPVLVCDGCGKRRGVVNHWHSLSIYSKELRISRQEVLNDADYHACGDGCVVLLVQLFLTNGFVPQWRDPNQADAVVGRTISTDVPF